MRRERLVDDYGTNSQWYKANSNELAIIEKARNEVKGL